MSLASRRAAAPPAAEEAQPLDRLRSLLPAIAASVAALDVDRAFPEEDVAAPAAEGLLRRSSARPGPGGAPPP